MVSIVRAVPLLIAVAVAVFRAPDVEALPARVESLKLVGGAEIEARVPGNWSSFRNSFGVPLMIMGPEGVVKRPVLTFSSTKAEKKDFNDKQLEANSEEYRSGRRAWLLKNGGTLIKFLPVRATKTRGDLAFRRIGYQYRLNGTAFEDEFMMAVCKNSLLFVSTMMPLSLKTDRSAEMEALLESVSCR